MLDVEARAHAAVRPEKRVRFEFLLAARSGLARITAEMCCWGAIDTPALERQRILTEDALTALIPDGRLAAAAAAAWARADAALLHDPGTAEWCAVCQHGGYSTNDLIGSLSQLLD